MADDSDAIKVLVVDDEEAIVELVGEYLRARGLTVITASDGDEAVGLLMREDLDVVLADLRLPARGGMALLESASDLLHPVAVVVMTGYGTVETATQAMKLGASDYLLKPVRLREVHDALLRAVDDMREKHDAARRKELCTLYEELLGLRGAVGPDALLARLCTVVRHGTQSTAVRGELLQGGSWSERCVTGEAPDGEPDELIELTLEGDLGLGLRLSIFGPRRRELEPAFVQGLSSRVLERLVVQGGGDLPTTV